MGAPNYITDDKGNIMYPRTLAKCVKMGGTTLDDYLDKVEDNLLIKPITQGTEMMLTDSSDMNIQELHLYGRTEQASTTGANLFDVNDRLSFNSIFKVDEEGYITATIPANNTEDYQYYNFFTKKSNLVKANTNYLIICEVVKMPTTKCSIKLTSVDKYIPGQIDNVITILGKTSGLEINLMKTKSDMSDSESFTRGYFSTSPGFTENQIKFRVSVLEDTTITANTFKYEPYTGGQPSPSPDYPKEIASVKNPTIKIGGSNILNFENKESFEKNGIVCVVTDGIVKTKGTATLKTMIYLKGSYYIENGTYIFNPNPTKGTEAYESYIDLTNQVNLGMSCTSKKINTPITVDDNISKHPFTLMISISKGATIDMEWKPQLLRNDTLLPYESYKEIQSAQQTCELNGIDDVRDELIIRADGTGQLIQRLLEEELNDNSDYVTWYENTNTYGFLTKESKWLYRANKINIKSNKLKGITKEVGNPGTYDKNGIFVDTAGLYIKISKKYLTEYTVDALKTYLRDNPITVVGLLKAPIVTELSSEEVQKILTLHTNKPNTTIWNDQNAEMQITYVADTKNYIDNKFKELSDAIVASTNKE